MKYVYTFAVDARGSLRVFITYMKRKFSYSLGVHVDKSKWDMTMQRCKRNTTHGKSFTPAIKINAEIQRYEETIQSVANSYKEQERLMSINKIDMSVDQVLDIAKTITTIKIKLPKNGTFFTKTLFLTEKHLAIKSLFNLTI